MTTLREARTALAETLDEIDDLHVLPYRQARNPKPGDGWVISGRCEPSTYCQSSVRLTGVIVLGQDVVAAEQFFDTIAIEVLDKVTFIQGLPVADTSVEPALLPVEGGPGLNALTVTVTVEVEQ